MFQARGYAAHNATSPLVPFRFSRRDPGAHDVRIEIRYTGICHSDLHQARDDWSNALYPMVPGHEIVGRVVEAGNDVKNLKVGDYAGVGCMAETQEMLDFCAGHDIVSDVEIVPIQAVNEAFDRLSRYDVKYRFGIDMASLSSDKDVG